MGTMLNALDNQTAFMGIQTLAQPVFYNIAI